MATGPQTVEAEKTSTLLEGADIKISLFQGEHIYSASAHRFGTNTGFGKEIKFLEVDQILHST